MAEKITLAFIARQQRDILSRLISIDERIGKIEDDVTVLTGMAIRNDGLLRLVTRFDQRLRKLENRPT
jgi:hypothetical protein